MPSLEGFEDTFVVQCPHRAVRFKESFSCRAFDHMGEIHISSLWCNALNCDEVRDESGEVALIIAAVP